MQIADNARDPRAYPIVGFAMGACSGNRPSSSVPCLFFERRDEDDEENGRKLIMRTIGSAGALP